MLKILDFLPGIKTVSAGLGLILVGLAFGADAMAQNFGGDLISDKVSTYSEAILYIGNGLGIIGIRTKLER